MHNGTDRQTQERAGEAEKEAGRERERERRRKQTCKRPAINVYSTSDSRTWFRVLGFTALLTLTPPCANVCVRTHVHAHTHVHCEATAGGERERTRMHLAHDSKGHRAQYSTGRYLPQQVAQAKPRAILTGWTHAQARIRAVDRLVFVGL